jgi:hypothetical protein
MLKWFALIYFFTMTSVLVAVFYNIEQICRRNLQNDIIHFGNNTTDKNNK